MRGFIKRRRKRTLLIAAVVLVAAAGAVAYAAWTESVNQPPTKGQLGSLATVTASAPSVAPGTNNCFPGATCDGNITLTNPGTSALKLVSFTASSTSISNTATVSGAQGTCTNTDILNNVSIPAQTGLSISIPPGTSTITVPNLFSVGASIPSGCQGAVFTLNIASSAGFVLTVSS